MFLISNQTYYFPPGGGFIKVGFAYFVPDGMMYFDSDGTSCCMSPKTYSDILKSGQLMEDCKVVRLLFEV